MRSLELDCATHSDAACCASALDMVVRQHDQRSNGHHGQIETLLPVQSPSALIGRFVGFNETGAPLVQIASGDAGNAVAARSTVALKPDQIDSEVALLFAAGDPAQPIIVGCIMPPRPTALQPQQPVDAELNGKRLEFTAEDEIVLRCGKSSITLTQAGKVIIRGAYLLSRSSGVNRIKGGSVQIN